MGAGVHIGVDIDLTDYGVGITDLARASEDAGLESLFLTQRMHLPVSRTDLLDQEGHEMDANLLDPFVALGAAAAVTSRLKLGTGACYAALYDPIILAKQVSTLDQISSGRFLFGITPGWLEEEVSNHGVEPALRWQVMREKVLAMKAIWTDDNAEYHGRFVDFAPIHTGLRPVQRPHPPILVGSNGSKGLARAVEFGDEWFPIVSPKLDLASHLSELKRLCQAAGRSTVMVTAFLWDLDEPLLGRCAELGVNRSIIYLYPKTQEVVRTFLERCTRLVDHF
jgi:probable F420-dependent oxidoreductase